MNAMDKAQTHAAWKLAELCMKSCPDAYDKMLAERDALKSELEVADAEMQNLRNHAYVWAGSEPFSGQDVIDLLNQNEGLRKQLAALEKVAEAARPFSEAEECGAGFIIAEDSDHTYPCPECERVFALHRALAELEATQ